MNRTTDWYQVENLTDHTVQLSEGAPTLPARIFVIRGEESTLVTDAGLGIGDLRSLVADLCDSPPRLFLTHSHWDHIGNASQFDDVAINDIERPSNGLVAIDSLTDEFTERPRAFTERFLADGGRFPDVFEPDEYEISPRPDVDGISDGHEFDLGERRLEAIHTPGHSPGHTVLLDRDSGILYGGDIIHFDLGLYVHFDDCDLVDLEASLSGLVDLFESGAYDTLLTCHNPPVRGADLSILQRLQTGLEALLDGELAFREVETDYGPAHAYDIDGSTVLTKPIAF